MAEMRLLQIEKEHHKQAFQVYYSLGPTRSYSKVASEFGVSQSAVKSWGRSFGWQQRVFEQDAEVAREVANRTIGTEIDRRERSMKIVEMALVRLAKAIADGQVRMTLSDLDRLLRLEAFLRDEPDSRQEVVFGDLRNKSTEELRQMMRDEMELLRELPGCE